MTKSKHQHLWAVVALLCGCLALAAQENEYKAYPFRERHFFPAMPEDTANRVTMAGARLGRYLFYDTILSLRRNMSCASCHKQVYAFSDAPARFSKGAAGVRMQRNTPPLFNLAWYPSLFWDGRAAGIEAQVFHPVAAASEMNLAWPVAGKRISESPFYRPQFIQVFGTGQADSNLIARAIGQFLRTLISDRTRYDKVLHGDAKFTPEETEGFILVNDQTKGNCLLCHTTDADALGTIREFSNIGLEVVRRVGQYKDKGLGAITKLASDNGKFKIPSLRNVALTAPYMHDGRFATLEAVLDYYSEELRWTPNIDPRLASVHRGGAHLSAGEKKKIIAFLRTLTDSAFILDPEFSNPFSAPLPKQ